VFRRDFEFYRLRDGLCQGLGHAGVHEFCVAHPQPLVSDPRLDGLPGLVIVFGFIILVFLYVRYLDEEWDPFDDLDRFQDDWEGSFS